MVTYLILNTAVLAVVLAVLWRMKALHWNRTIAMTLLVLLLTTALFDSLIILADIVAYNPDKLLGLYIGTAPIEDFFYALAAAIVIPGVWNLTKKRKTNE